MGLGVSFPVGGFDSKPVSGAEGVSGVGLGYDSSDVVSPPCAVFWYAPPGFCSVSQFCGFNDDFVASFSGKTLSCVVHTQRCAMYLAPFVAFHLAT